MTATSKPRHAPQPLYVHQPHPHTPRSANARHAEERAEAASTGRLAAFNETLAVWITAHVGTMLCGYIFLAIGVGSLVGVFTNNALLAAVCGSVSSYVLQLILLPVIQLGSNLLSRHAELQSDEQFKATTRTLHESEQMMRHLDAQDTELLQQTALLTAMARTLAGAAERIPAPPLVITGNHTTASFALPDTPPDTPAPAQPTKSTVRATGPQSRRKRS